MKKLLFAVSALAALSLLAPSTGFAQLTGAYNQVGLYMTPDGTGATGTSQIGVPTLVYLVLTRPTDRLNGDTPYATINAYECTLTFTPTPNSNLFVLNAGLPPSALNVGPSTDINTGVLDFIVGIGDQSPLAVTNEAAVLVTFTFMNTSVGQFAVTIGPTSKPGIAGEMAFQSVSGQLREMYSASGSTTDPIFIFNGEAVPVEEESFGSVKALFR